MQQRTSERAYAWILAFMFHGALIIGSAAIVISAPPHTVPEIGVDLSIRSPAEVVASGVPVPSMTAASPPAQSVQPVRARTFVRPPVPANLPDGVETSEEPAAASSAAEVPAVQSGDGPVADAGQEFSFAHERKLIHARDPVFPARLGASGQEVECEARIAVAASGAVTRVEITRSSGYIEIDASVEAALRDYLFSRVTERKDTVGTIRFRFRLERQD